MSVSDPLSLIRAVLEPHGIFLRGLVHFREGEGPPLDSGHAASVVLLGNIGGSLWPSFSAWLDLHAGIADPLDTWSKRMIVPVAERVSARAFFPSDPPWQPFQQWAMRCEGMSPSPLGLLIHPVYGLWHGYRGALAFAERLAGAEQAVLAGHPCDSCAEKPCLSNCPAAAVSASGFEVGACRKHLITRQGQAGCMVAGCLARNACPVGAQYRYPAAQLRFHMAALGV